MNNTQITKFRRITFGENTNNERNITVPMNFIEENNYIVRQCDISGQNYIGNYCSYVNCIRINQLNILTQQIYNDRIANINLLSENESNRIWMRCENIARRQINFTNSLIPRYP